MCPHDKKADGSEGRGALDCPDAVDPETPDDRCSECWVTKWFEAMNNSADGIAIRRAAEVKQSIDIGLTVQYDELPVDQFIALSHLKMAIAKKESEQVQDQ